MKTIFFGTPEFAVPILDALQESGHLPLAVVCQPDRPSGRGRKLKAPAVKLWALERGLEVLQPEKQKDQDFLERLESLAPDLGLVAAFGQLIPRRVLDLPPMGFINVHPSLIPRYRGAAPMQWTLINGDERGGVSIIKVTPKLDDGDVLLQESVDIPQEENMEGLHDRLALLGGRLLVRVVESYGRGEVQGQPQDEDQVIWAPALTKEDGRLDWSRSALELHNRIRGVQPWPGAWTRLGGRLLKVHAARVAELPTEEPAEAGTVVKAAKGEILVACGEGCLQLLDVQLEGKKRMEAQAFLAGRALVAGDRLLS